MHRILKLYPKTIFNKKNYVSYLSTLAVFGRKRKILTLPTSVTAQTRNRQALFQTSDDSGAQDDVRNCAKPRGSFDDKFSQPQQREQFLMFLDSLEVPESADAWAETGRSPHYGSRVYNNGNTQ